MTDQITLGIISYSFKYSNSIFPPSQKHLSDGACNAGSLPNGFKAASLTAWKQEKNPTFDQMVVAIQDGPVSVGIKVGIQNIV